MPTAHAPGPPQHGADARLQLLEVERLGDVVVGAELEALELVRLLIARRQHDDRRAAALPDRVRTARIRPGPAASHPAARGRARRRARGRSPRPRRPRSSTSNPENARLSDSTAPARGRLRRSGCVACSRLRLARSSAATRGPWYRADLAGNRATAPVILDNAAHDRQAETGAALPRPLAAIELVEHARQVAGGMPSPRSATSTIATTAGRSVAVTPSQWPSAPCTDGVVDQVVEGVESIRWSAFRSTRVEAGSFSCRSMRALRELR